MRIVDIVTILFLLVTVVGMTIVLSGTYNPANQTAMKLIEKDHAKQIAHKYGNWDLQSLTGKETSSVLLHVKNDGFVFVSDEKSLQDKELFMTKLFEVEENQYVWLITVSSTAGSNREWGYVIDASDGSVITSMEETLAIFEPKNPHEFTGNVIEQAKGDVVIVFPNGVSDAVPMYSPFPAQLLISKGDTVTWINEDSVVHAVTSVSESNHVGKVFDSGLMTSKQSFSHTFEEERWYQYVCSVHPWINGGIFVQSLEE